MSYDKQFDNFLEGTRFSINLVSEPPQLQFREIKIPKEHGGDGVTEVKVNLKKHLLNAYLPEIGEFNLTEEFKHSGPSALMETDNEFGYVVIALGKCAFMIERQNLYNLLTANFNPADFDIKQSVTAIFKCSETITYLKLTLNKIVICAKNKLDIFPRNRNAFNSPNEQVSFDLDEGAWVR